MQAETLVSVQLNTPVIHWDPWNPGKQSQDSVVTLKMPPFMHSEKWSVYTVPLNTFTAWITSFIWLQPVLSLCVSRTHCKRTRHSYREITNCKQFSSQLHAVESFATLQFLFLVRWSMLAHPLRRCTEARRRLGERRRLHRVLSCLTSGLHCEHSTQ